MHSHQECPRCNGAINVENTAVESLIMHEVRFLYCEFCGVGVETLVKVDGDQQWECMRSTFDRSRPIQLGMFLQRLRNVAEVSATKFNKTVSSLRSLQVA